MTQLTINRSSEYVNKMRSIHIYIDGVKVGSVSDGKSQTFDITPGKHTVKAKIDWCGSQEKEIYCSEGDHTHMNLAGFAGGKFTSVKHFLLIIFLPLIFLFIHVENPVYQVFEYLAKAMYLILGVGMLYLFTIGRNKYLQLN